MTAADTLIVRCSLARHQVVSNSSQSTNRMRTRWRQRVKLPLCLGGIHRMGQSPLSRQTEKKKKGRGISELML